MTILTDKDYESLANRLRDYLQDGLDCGTYPFLGEEEADDICGVCEPLYVTKMCADSDKFLILHWGWVGDWTRALLIPEDNFEEPDDGWSPAMEALEWFFRG